MRSELNKALDACPKIVQDAVWGEDGYRDQIETLKNALAETSKELSRVIEAHNELTEPWHYIDAETCHKNTRLLEKIERLEGYPCWTLSLTTGCGS